MWSQDYSLFAAFRNLNPKDGQYSEYSIMYFSCAILYFVPVSVGVTNDPSVESDFPLILALPGKLTETFF